MIRAVDLAKSVYHVASRAAERILPPIALWYLLTPLNELLAALQARRSNEHAPTDRIPRPPASKRPSAFRRWRHYGREQRHWWLLGWMDRLSERKWQSRLQVHGLEKLTAVLAERPVIVASIHTTPIMTLAAWLRAMGLPVAHVPVDPSWFSSAARMRKAALAEKIGVPFAIRPESPRAMVEFLTPGHALLLTADYALQRVTEVPLDGARVTAATGLYRLARTTGAAVVPLIILETGRWRYELTVFDAVPQNLIDAADTAAAARYVVERLVPPVIARPEQALAVLVDTIR